MVRSTTIAARPLIAGTSAIGWVRSQLALKTGSFTWGSCVGGGVRDGEGVAVATGWRLGAAREATAGRGVGV